MLVRLFDANGAYITHFVTKELFAGPGCGEYTPGGEDDWDHNNCYASVNVGGAILLKDSLNIMQYRISQRDAAYVQQGEFGLYVPR
jgi:hypothetical protein